MSMKNDLSKSEPESEDHSDRIPDAHKSREFDAGVVKPKPQKPSKGYTQEEFDSMLAKIFDPSVIIASKMNGPPEEAKKYEVLFLKRRASE